MNERAQQDLALIRRLMEETRQEVTDRGRHLLLWGLITSAGVLATWLVAIGRLALSAGWIWGVLLVIGWAGSFAIGAAESRRACVRVLGRRVLNAVWMAAGVTLTTVAVAGLTDGVVPVRALPGLMAVLIAAPVLLSALLTGERWLGGVAAGWWLAGVVMLFAPGLYTLPLMAVLSLVLMALPGLVLHTRARQRATGAGVAADG